MSCLPGVLQQGRSAPSTNSILLVPPHKASAKIYMHVISDVESESWTLIPVSVSLLALHSRSTAT